MDECAAFYASQLEDWPVLHTAGADDMHDGVGSKLPAFATDAFPAMGWSKNKARGALSPTASLPSLVPRAHLTVQACAQTRRRWACCA